MTLKELKKQIKFTNKNFKEWSRASEAVRKAFNELLEAYEKELNKLTKEK